MYCAFSALWRKVSGTSHNLSYHPLTANKLESLVSPPPSILSNKYIFTTKFQPSHTQGVCWANLGQGQDGMGWGHKATPLWFSTLRILPSSTKPLGEAIFSLTSLPGRIQTYLRAVLGCDRFPKFSLCYRAFICFSESPLLEITPSATEKTLSPALPVPIQTLWSEDMLSYLPDFTCSAYSSSWLLRRFVHPPCEAQEHWSSLLFFHEFVSLGLRQEDHLLGGIEGVRRGPDMGKHTRFWEDSKTLS